MTCAECTSRGYVYRADCQGCQARMIGRTPAKIAARWFQTWRASQDEEAVQAMRAAIVEERRLDRLES